MRPYVTTTVSELPESRVSIACEVSPAVLRKAIDKSATKIGKNLKIPGFRKGHVPTKVIISRFGREAVIDDAIREELGFWYAEALAESDIEPVGDPKIEIGELPTPLQAKLPWLRKFRPQTVSSTLRPCALSALWLHQVHSLEGDSLISSVDSPAARPAACQSLHQSGFLFPRRITGTGRSHTHTRIAVQLDVESATIRRPRHVCAAAARAGNVGAGAARVTTGSHGQ